eukprot:scpid52374/ scgid31949/ 
MVHVYNHDVTLIPINTKYKHCMHAIHVAENYTRLYVEKIQYHSMNRKQCVLSTRQSNAGTDSGLVKRQSSSNTDMCNANTMAQERSVAADRTVFSRAIW